MCFNRQNNQVLPNQEFFKPVPQKRFAPVKISNVFKMHLKVYYTEAKKTLQVISPTKLSQYIVSVILHNLLLVYVCPLEDVS